MNLTSIQSSTNIILFHVSSNINEEIKNKEKLLLFYILKDIYISITIDDVGNCSYLLIKD